MKKVIELEDIDIESLSKETLNLISKLAAEILTISGKSFSFNDPFLLPKIRRQVKKLKNPQLNSLYYQYKYELKRSVKNGNFGIRPYQVSDTKAKSIFNINLFPAMA